MMTSKSKNVLIADNILSDKQRKNLSILELIVKQGPISRTEISRHTGLNIVTISNYINEFIGSELIIEKGFDVSTGGRRPTLIELNPKFGHMIGVGLTASEITGVLVDPKMQVACEVKKERPADNSEAIIGALVDTVEDILAKSKIGPEKIKGLGIGIPGVIDVEGQTIKWLGPMGSSMISISGVSLKDIFEKEFDIPTMVEHDAACAAFGERWFGFESEINNMMYMYSGVGCGLIINGQIYRGSNGSAGELGIFSAASADPDARRRDSAGLGIWELDLGVSHYAREAMKKGIKSRIFELAANNPDKIEAGLVMEASKTGDKLAGELLENAGNHLGMKIAFLVNLLNPEVVVVGGGLEQAGSVFMDSVKKAVHSWAREEGIRNLRIVPAKLGKNSVAMGAACVVMERIFMNA